MIQNKLVIVIKNSDCAIKKLLKINHENTKQDVEMNLAPFGRIWKILDTDYTDYTDSYGLGLYC